MISDNEKNKFLEELRKNPLISSVCNKAGISKATIYRWRKDDKIFKEMMSEAQVEGRELLNDAAESVIYTGIKNKEFRAASYYLEHNHPNYMKNKFVVDQYKQDDFRKKPSGAEKVADMVEVLDILYKRHGEDGVKKMLEREQESKSNDQNTK